MFLLYSMSEWEQLLNAHNYTGRSSVLCAGVVFCSINVLEIFVFPGNSKLHSNLTHSQHKTWVFISKKDRMDVLLKVAPTYAN